MKDDVVRIREALERGPATANDLRDLLGMTQLRAFRGIYVLKSYRHARTAGRIANPDLSRVGLRGYRPTLVLYELTPCGRAYLKRSSHAHAFDQAAE
jgi:hypothetical protein